MPWEKKEGSKKADRKGGGGKVGGGTRPRTRGKIVRGATQVFSCWTGKLITGKEKKATK